MKVLITSGGGAKGAFSVGVLRYLKNEQQIDQFDLISGTSTGSLIATLASTRNIERLADIYLDTTNADVLMPQNIIDSIVQGKPFVYDTEPLLKQVNNNIDAATYNQIMNSNTTLCFNAVSLQSGKVTVFCTKDILPANQYTVVKINDRQTMIDALLGSSNQAVFMNPIHIGNDDYVDGGNREVIPTRVVVQNLTLNEEHEIYILSNNPNELVTFPGKKYKNILDVLIRAISMFVQEVRENDLEVMAKFKTFYDINKTSQQLKMKIFYICPPFELDRQFSTGLRFDKGRMMQWMLKGEETAREIIETTPFGNFPLFHAANRPF